MAVCPNGHDSASDDFCDVCGMRIGRPDSVGRRPADRGLRAREPRGLRGPRRLACSRSRVRR